MILLPFPHLHPTAARNCMRLQVLELDHVSEINQEVAAEVCREGLKGLEMLVLTSTPVTPKALLHFNSEYGALIQTSKLFIGVCVYTCTDTKIIDATMQPLMQVFVAT